MMIDRRRMTGIVLALATMVFCTAFSKTQWTTYGPSNDPPGSGAAQIDGITPDPQAGAVLITAYATSGQIPNITGRMNGVWKTPDGGHNWSRFANGPGGPTDLAVDPTNSSVLFAGGPNAQFWKSTDGGTNWSLVYNSVAPSPWGRIAISQDGQTLYVATGACGTGLTSCKVMKSINRGMAWAAVGGAAALPASRSNIVAIDPGNAQTVYVAGFATATDQVFKSTDGGATFSSNGFSGATISDMRVIDANTAYVVTNSSVYRTTTGGASWDDITSGIPAGSGSLRRLIVDPLDPTILYVSASGATVHSVWRKFGSADWAQFTTTGLTDTALLALSIDHNGKLLHAGSVSGRVFIFQLRD